MVKGNSATITIAKMENAHEEETSAMSFVIQKGVVKERRLRKQLKTSVDSVPCAG